MRNKYLQSAAIASAITLLSANYSQAKVTTTTLPTIIVQDNKESDNEKFNLIPLNYTADVDYITKEDIEKKETSDIHRVLREVPGVTIREEDGFGLRPNIGIRGGRSNRSADINLMEDGVNISPAPYSASSAYYFPALGRMEGIEVYKGGSSIKFGPRTTSGAINLITKQIPNKAEANFKSSYGSFNTKEATLDFGNSYDNFGYLVNLDHKSSDGFKKLDNGGDTGFEVNDILTKFRFNNDKDSDIYHEFEVKLAHSSQVSNETYTGLSLGDFNQDLNRRYGATQLDEMDNKHYQIQLDHRAEISENFALKTTAYYNEFTRNWYKLDKVNGNSLSKSFNGDNPEDLDVLRGMGSGTIDIKANNRHYVSQGVQFALENKFNTGKVKHSLVNGIRIHDDYEDRFQRSDVYGINSGVLTLTTPGSDGSSGSNNRIGSSRAYSAYTEDTIQIGKFTVVPGLRFEHIEAKQRRYESDPARSGTPDSIKNSTDIFIPAISTSYKFNDNYSVFAGVHKGFAPAPPSSTVSPEKSTNYETGFRFRGEKESFVETALFYNDYSNLTSEDSNGDKVNGGKAISYGLEFGAGIKPTAKILNKDFKLPLKATYTLNHSEFTSSFKSDSDIWDNGTVQKGDAVPYIARHQFTLSAGFEVDKIALNLSTSYVDQMRTQPGSGPIDKGDKIPSYFIADASFYYQATKQLQLFTAIDNIFDRGYAVSAFPYGLRPGKPQAIKGGLRYKF